MSWQTETWYCREGHITLYKRPSKKPRWQMRLSIPGYKRYITKTTGTADKALAITIANEQWDNAYLLWKQGVDPRGYTYTSMFKEWVNTCYAERPDIAKSVLGFNRYLIFFDTITMQDINQLYVDEYWQYRKTYWETRTLVGNATKNPAIRTLQLEAGKMKAFWRWAVARGYANRQLDFSPSLKNKGVSRRDAFTREDQDSILQLCRQYQHATGQGVTVKRYTNQVLEYLIIFLLGTGIRPGTELERITWNDVVNRKNHSIVTVTGKTGKRRVITNKQAKNALYQLQQFTKYDKPNDYVFSNYYGNSRAINWSGNFSKLITTLNITSNKTIYSLRHSYCTEQLESGADVYALATNMGTSVKQIESHYSHVDIEQLRKHLVIT